MKLKLNKKRIIIITIFMIVISIHAHGDNKPGPHGGKISMPGAFHTEIISYQDTGFKIYLLDINFGNPIVSNSSVKAKIKSKGIETALNCKGDKDHFYCAKTSGSVTGAEELYILAERNNAKGIEIKYQLPLKEN